MRQRLFAILGLAGIVLAIVVGDGLTLTRCLLTGRVTLTCCCQASPPSTSNESTVDEPDSCCSFQHLAAAWPTAPSGSRATTPPTLALTNREPGPLPGAGAPSRWAGAAPPAGEPPPIWRTALRI